jgi:hypothetical protein
VKVVQEGDPSLYDPSAGKEELERRWKEAIASALMAQKTAGKLPAGVERLFDEVLKPKVNIRALFRQAIRSGLGRMVVSDWTRPSRKNPDLPGVKRLTIPSIFALVDTCLAAGSMVTMSDGTQKAIENIKVGDSILGVKDGQITNGTVLAKFTFDRREIVRIVLDDGTKIYCTPEHHFLTTSGWKKAKDLKPMEPVYVLEQYGRSSSDFGGVSRQGDGSVPSETVDEGGRRISEGELPKDEPSRTFKNTSQKRSRRSDKNLPTRSIDNDGDEMLQEERVSKTTSNTRGSRLLGWDCGRRRNHHFSLEKGKVMLQKLCSLCENNTIFQHFEFQQRIAGNRQREIQLQKCKKATDSLQTSKKALLPGLRRRSGNTSHIGGNMSVPETEKKTVRNSDKLHKTATEETSIYAIYHRGHQGLLDSQRAKLGLRKVVKVETTGRTERVFDLTTTTNNYFVNGVLCHNSGSIGEKELSLFVGTVLEFAGQTKVHVICWDATAYEPIKLRNRSVEPLKGKMRGGGGTVIRPALKKTLEQMRPLDMVAILSDFEILDWDEPEVQELLSKVAARASVAVLLSTYKEVSHPRWRFLRLH